MSRIVLDAVSKQFPGGTTAVKSLDLEVSDGELLVLVGPSGCGKTTALRMVAGLEEVSSGTIYIDGRPVNDLEPRHRDIAMVFQSYALYPHLSVYDNMAFSLKYRKVPRRPRSRSGSTRPRGSSSSSPTWSASRGSCPAGSGSGWRWAGPSSASRAPS